MILPTKANKPLLEAHLQEWFAQLIPSLTDAQASRLDSLNLMQIARLSGINQGNLRLFALGQRGLRLPNLGNLVTVVEGLGYKPLNHNFES